VGHKISGECLIFGDIAGQWEAVQSIIKQAPDVLPVSVGDMIDRGTQSKEVVDFFLTHGKALKGNHEHMCVDFVQGGDFYDHGIWYSNGGIKSVLSFLEIDYDYFVSLRSIQVRNQLQDLGVGKKLDVLPLYFELDEGGLVTHAPLKAGLSLEDACDLGTGFSYRYCPISDRSVIWNRREPGKIEGKYQIFGHNSGWGHTYFQDDGEWGVCLDSSKQGKLTAMHWPSRDIYVALI